jgi:hypothetical protein
MATTYKVLGQINPSATSLSNLYIVPAATSTVCSTLVVCNQAAVAATFRLAVRPAGAAINFKHYISYDTSVPANDSISLTMGMTLGNTDVVSVYASTANVSFNLFGSEITA